MGTKGCFRMKEGEPLKDRRTELVTQLPRQRCEGLSYLLPLPLMGLVQSSSPETSERRRRRRYHSIIPKKANWLAVQAPQTCEVDGLYRLDKLRLLHFKPLQQLRDEAQDVELRKRNFWISGLSQAATLLRQM